MVVYAAIVGLSCGRQPQSEPQPQQTQRLVIPGLAMGEPAPEPTVEAETTPEVRVWPSQLTRDELMAVYDLADVPDEWRESLASIAWCESRWSPGALGDGGNSLGLHQMNALWFRYGGLDPEDWANPVTNTLAAVAAIRYDLAKGYEPFVQWTCSPA